MSNIIMLIFTGVIAASTVAYTIYSARLWKATMRSVDVTRLLAFLNCWTQLHSLIQEAKAQGDPSAQFLEQLEVLLIETGGEHFTKDIDIRGDKELISYLSKIEVITRTHVQNPEGLWWYRLVRKKLEE